jgi:hypothetical protein
MSNESDEKETIVKKSNLKNLTDMTQAKMSDGPFEVLLATQKLEAPSAPLNFNATQNFASDENKIILTWKPPTNTGGTPISLLTYLVALKKHTSSSSGPKVGGFVVDGMYIPEMTLPKQPGPIMMDLPNKSEDLVWKDAGTKLTYTFEKDFEKDFKAGDFYTFYVKAVGIDGDYSKNDSSNVMSVKGVGIKTDHLPNSDSPKLIKEGNHVKMYNDNDGSFIAIFNYRISSAVEVTYMFIGRPSEPRNFQTTFGHPTERKSVFVLTWEPPETNGYSEIVRYEVLCDDGETWTTPTGNKTHQCDLLPYYKGRYDFAVRAVNKAGRLGIPAKTVYCFPT